MQNTCKCTIQLLVLVLIPIMLRAQGGYRPHPLLSPMWQADAEYMIPSQVGDSSVQNGFTGLAFTFRSPLYTGKDWLSADGGKPFFAVLAQGSAHYRQSQVDYIEPDRALTQMRVGITGLMAKGLRHLIMANGSLSLPTASFGFRARSLRLHGSLIWRKLYHNNRLWHTLGITYTPITGKDRLLPVAGIGYTLGNEDQVQLTFPFNASYTHVFSKQFSLILRAQNMGGYHVKTADSNHREDPLRYRFNFPRTGVVGRWYGVRHTVITAEAGMTTGGRVCLDGISATQSPAPYFKLSLQVRFGDRPAAAPIMNFDPGDSGFDPAYIVE